MAKFWNFILFQAGWFACVLGAAHQHLRWAVPGVLIYLAFHIWRSSNPRREARFFIQVLIYGLVSDSLLMYLGFLDFGSAWPSPYLSPIWMWALWLLVASTLNGSLAWLRAKPFLGGLLGAIGGPLSYLAGIRLGAANWGSSSQILGLCLICLIWIIAVPLFFYWDRALVDQV